MEVISKANYQRVSPQKARLVADNLKGKPVEDVINILEFTPKKAASIIAKVVNSALANAEHNYSMDVDDLYVKQVKIDGGPMWKRIRPRAMGRATRILKRTSHITVIVDEL